MTDKPTLWITRKLSDNTVARAHKNYTVIVETVDEPQNSETIIKRSHEVDAIIPCHSEIFTRDVVEQLGPRLKIVANHSVGVDHCDLPAFKDKGIIVTNTHRMFYRTPPQR